MNWTTTATLRWISLSPVNLKVLQPLWSTAKLMWTWWIRVAGASCTRPSKEVRGVWDLFHSNQRFALHRLLCISQYSLPCLKMFLRPLLQGTSLPPSFWFGTRLRWMQPQWARWRPRSTWSALSAPRNTLQKLWLEWQRSQMPCWRPERTPTCRTARAGRSQDFGIFKLIEIDNSCLEYDDHSIWLSFVVQQNSTARSCGVGKRASVQPVAAVQTVSLVWLHFQSWNTVNDKWHVNISVNER